MNAEVVAHSVTRAMEIIETDVPQGFARQNV